MGINNQIIGMSRLGGGGIGEQIDKWIGNQLVPIGRQMVKLLLGHCTFYQLPILTPSSLALPCALGECGSFQLCPTLPPPISDRQHQSIIFTPWWHFPQLINPKPCTHLLFFLHTCRYCLLVPSQEYCQVACLQLYWIFPVLFRIA